jgi:hypothetical protein
MDEVALSPPPRSPDNYDRKKPNFAVGDPSINPCAICHSRFLLENLFFFDCSHGWCHQCIVRYVESTFKMSRSSFCGIFPQKVCCSETMAEKRLLVPSPHSPIVRFIG